MPVVLRTKVACLSEAGTKLVPMVCEALTWKDNQGNLANLKLKHREPFPQDLMKIAKMWPYPGPYLGIWTVIIRG